MRKIFVIDWTLIPLFILSTSTGVALHITGHGNDHALWHTWAVWHIVTSLLLLVAMLFHITMHWAWYKTLIRHGIGRKSKITAALSTVFAVVVATGIALLGTEGANSALGVWHYKAGLLAGALCTGHLLKRIPALRKSLKK